MKQSQKNCLETKIETFRRIISLSYFDVHPGFWLFMVVGPVFARLETKGISSDLVQKPL